MAPGVIGLDFESVAETFFGGGLKRVVMAVGAGCELGDGGESRIGRRGVGERGEAALANGLVAVDLSGVGLVDGAGSYVLGAQVNGARRSDAPERSSIP